MAAPASPLLAQQAGADGSAPVMLDSVKVTASKRTTLVEKTPMAISAITAEQLDELGAVDIKDYAAQVPGLRIQYNGPGANRISLRGVNSSGEATVGVYYDETPVAGSTGVSSDAGGRSPDLELFDVDRIEVLRGPQGTLYGASSMGGAIRILYQKPTQELEGRVEAGYEGTRGGDPSGSQNLMLNVPLAKDVLAARLTAYNRETGGYVDNTFLGIDDINSAHAKGARLQLRYTPTEDVTVDFSQSKGSTDAFSSTWHPSQGDYKQLSQVKLPYDDDTQMDSLTLDWDLGWASLTANTSYQRRASTYISDDSYYIQTYLTPTACANDLGAACDAGQLQSWYDQVNSLVPAALIHDGITRDRTAEVRLTSADSDFIDWTVGVFSQNRDNYVASQDAPADAASGEIITPWELFYRRQIWDKLKQKAVFGEATWHATDRLNLTAGLRFYDYDKTVTGITDIPWDMIGATYKPLTSVDASERGWLRKFTVDYSVSDSVMLYATAADGFRPGGANQVIGLDEALTAYRSDKLWNYEIGAKSAWLDRSLLVNVALYQIDWDDMQVSGRTLNGAFSFLSNAGAARMRGAELEAIWRPLAGLDLSANFNYVDAKLTEDQVSDVINGAGRAGDRVPNIPRSSGMLAAAYRFPISAGLDGMVRVDGSYVGGSYSLFSGTYNVWKDSYTTVGLRAGVESSDDRWAAYLYVQNLTDEVALNQYTLSSTPPYGSATSLRPRTVGMNVSFNF
ncbi:TonB-dependent receptor [Stenotrophomonas sp. MMGLT7]|uniref:TonB-dependent receptor n=1 Tax=Stenotrophomonas sp. MMGLT7 TaxID=2901227 RepID=UPI001E35ADF5|nr:TonB-dependent receptor [Stenotrophomonas sp. MMGLT7]MCD7096858.1 TonB-dependent receptor [Stenotrophomonas sp. MMGLT7]